MFIYSILSLLLSFTQPVKVFSPGDTIVADIYRFGISLTEKPVSFVCVDSNEHYNLFYPYERKPVTSIARTIGSRYTILAGNEVLSASHLFKREWAEFSPYLDQFEIHFLRLIKESHTADFRWYFGSDGLILRGQGPSSSSIQVFPIEEIPQDQPIIAIAFSPFFEDSIIYLATPYQVLVGYAVGSPPFYDGWSFQLLGDTLPLIRSLFSLNDTLIFASTGEGVFRWDGTSWDHVLSGIGVNEILRKGDTLIAATEDGLYSSDLDGTSWSHYLFDGDIPSIVFVGDTILAPVNDVGVLRYTPGGTDTLREGLKGLPYEPIGGLSFHSISYDEGDLFVGTDVGLFEYQEDSWVSLSGNTCEKGIGNNVAKDVCDSASLLINQVFSEAYDNELSVFSDSLGISPSWEDKVNVLLFPVFEYINLLYRTYPDLSPIYSYPILDLKNSSYPSFAINISNETFRGPRWLGLDSDSRKKVIEYMLSRIGTYEIDTLEPTVFNAGYATLLTYWADQDFNQGLIAGFDSDSSIFRFLFEGSESYPYGPNIKEIDRERLLFFSDYIYEQFGKDEFLSLLSDPDTGISALNKFLDAHGTSLLSFLSKWALSTWVNEPSTGYGYSKIELPQFTTSYLISQLPQGPDSLFLDPLSFSTMRFSLNSPYTLYFNADAGDSMSAFTIKYISGGDIEIDSLPLDSNFYGVDTILESSIDSTDLLVFNLDRDLRRAFYGSGYSNSVLPPVNLHAVSGHRNVVPLSWDPPPVGIPAGTYLYKVYRSYNLSGPYDLVKSGIDGLTYVDSTVFPDTLYYYMASAVLNGSESGLSKADSARTVLFPPPRNLVGFQDASVYLQWNRPLDNLQCAYRVWKRDTLSNNYVLVDTTTEESYYLFPAPKGYAYAVTALYDNPQGESDFSNEVIPASGSSQWGVDTRADIKTGDVWNYVSDYGVPAGGDMNSGLFGFDWPGGEGHNYYIWGSYLAVGTKVNGIPYVTYSNYPRGEWGAGNIEYAPLPYSDYDVIAVCQDFMDENPWNASGRHTGLLIKERVLSWKSDPMLRFANALVFGITYDKDQCDIAGAGDTLKEVYLALWIDADVSGSDYTDPHIDDLVDFDGWDGPSTNTDEIDSITLLPDGTYLPYPDGVPDEYLVFGDEPDEHTLNGDTLIVSRSLSYMFDWDNYAEPGWDVGENGHSTGYIGASLIYAPPSPSDSVWVEDEDTLRMVRPAAHMWWDWENDPQTDADVYNYLSGHAPFYPGGNILPPPSYLGEGPFDYRFFLSAGPFDIADRETVYVIYGLGVGEGINGDNENVYYNPQWLPGLRHVIDRIWKEYYNGSKKSDPFHPSGLTEDTHWGGLLGVKEEANKNKTPFRLLSISPNPFSQSTLLRFSVQSKDVPIDLTMYDVAGRKVKTILKDAHLSPGFHEFSIDGRDDSGRLLPSGVYFVLFKAKGHQTKKLLLVR